MSLPPWKVSTKRLGANQRRGRPTFSEVWLEADRQVKEQVNRRSGRLQQKSIRASIAQVYEDEEDDITLGFWEWSKRTLWGVLLLPICWVTTWTFLSRLGASIEHGFWYGDQFWYFAVGVVWMLGMFGFKVAFEFFLFLYVLGHELTHAVFVLGCLGKVTGFKAGIDGGYITTTKTNLLIALSPYFVPFWSIVAGLIYGVIHWFVDLKGVWDLLFYGVLGVTWTFHMVWTLWMLPKDQPDLREHGTFFSLVLIYLVNLLLLVGLFCVASSHPWLDLKQFVLEWVKWATVSVHWVMQWVCG